MRSLIKEFEEFRNDEERVNLFFENLDEKVENFFDSADELMETIFEAVDNIVAEIDLGDDDEKNGEDNED